MQILFLEASLNMYVAEDIYSIKLSAALKALIYVRDILANT